MKISISELKLTAFRGKEIAGENIVSNNKIFETFIFYVAI
jgi:hypothetical protein